jgi:hypothetical protein|tara:strand:- start:574 stop:762 length:189 start_codon:yes stop_codon:yes gene_type:complete
MTMYLVVLYACMGLKCEFYQSLAYTTNKQECMKSVERQIEEGRLNGFKVDGTCVYIDIGTRV